MPPLAVNNWTHCNEPALLLMNVKERQLYWRFYWCGTCGSMGNVRKDGVRWIRPTMLLNKEIKVRRKR